MLYRLHPQPQNLPSEPSCRRSQGKGMGKRARALEKEDALRLAWPGEHCGVSVPAESHISCSPCTPAEYKMHILARQLSAGLRSRVQSLDSGSVPKACACTPVAVSFQSFLSVPCLWCTTGVPLVRCGAARGRPWTSFWWQRRGQATRATCASGWTRRRGTSTALVRPRKAVAAHCNCVR